MTLAKTDSPLSLVNHFLIAMPQLNNSYFANTVIYMWQHNSEGALGLVINLPIKMRMTDIFEQLGLTDLRMSTANPFILSGGPVETDKGFVLHDADPRWPSSLAVTENLSITTSRDILAAIGRGEGPQNYLIALGCSGWSAGQLEQELVQNSWFTCPATKDIIFSTEFSKKPNMAAATLGFSMAQLTNDVGYS
jgi:putative transcriptional regulator